MNVYLKAHHPDTMYILVTSWYTRELSSVTYLITTSYISTSREWLISWRRIFRPLTMCDCNLPIRRVRKNLCRNPQQPLHPPLQHQQQSGFHLPSRPQVSENWLKTLACNTAWIFTRTVSLSAMRMNKTMPSMLRSMNIMIVCILELRNDASIKIDCIVLLQYDIRNSQLLLCLL